LSQQRFGWRKNGSAAMASLGPNAVYNSDYFRQYVVDPQKFKPNVAMPDHPTFDSATLDALQTYFKTVLPGG
jgi:hypothetical protein